MAPRYVRKVLRSSGAPTHALPELYTNLIDGEETRSARVCAPTRYSHCTVLQRGLSCETTCVLLADASAVAPAPTLVPH